MKISNKGVKRLSNKTKYQSKSDQFSSHQLIRKQIFSFEFNNPKILDIGCYQGDLLNSLLIYYKKCYLIGLDSNYFITENQEKIKFIRHDFNNSEKLESLKIPKCDVIILGDILEHLVNPLKSLQAIKKIRNRNSRVFISIPNSGHWYFRLKVLFGKFEYEKNGLFDETHLRFYTLNTAKELISKSNLEIICIDYSSTPWENIFQNRTFTQILSRIERLLIFLRPQLFAYQMICTLK